MGLRIAWAKAQLGRAVVRKPSGGPPGFKSVEQAAITRVASNRQPRFKFAPRLQSAKQAAITRVAGGRF